MGSFLSQVLQRPEDKAKLMPYTTLIIESVHTYLGQKEAERFWEASATMLELLGHCCVDDEHRSAAVIRHNNGILSSLILPKILGLDSKLAHFENLQTAEQGLHPVVLMHRAVLYMMATLARPQKFVALAVTEKGDNKLYDLLKPPEVTGSITEENIQDKRSRNI